MDWVFDYFSEESNETAADVFAVPGGRRVRLEPTRVTRTGLLADLRFRVSSRERAND